MDKEKIGIAAAAVTAMGSGIAVSWLTTKYLMRIAMDRETIF